MDAHLGRILLLIPLTFLAGAGLLRGEEELQLFNGKDLDGWAHVGKGRVYVEDGLMKTEGGMGLLWYTREKFGDCRLKVVYRTTTLDDNSGIFIRIPEPPGDPWEAVHSGYEIQILENFPKDYDLSEHQKQHGLSWHTTGAIYSLSPATKQPQKAPGEWNTMEIHLEADRTRVYLNGELVNDFREGQEVPPKQHWYEPERGPRPAVGYVGIQNHHEPQTVHFKEIAIIRQAQRRPSESAPPAQPRPM